MAARKLTGTPMDVPCRTCNAKKGVPCTPENPYMVHNARMDDWAAKKARKAAK